MTPSFLFAHGAGAPSTHPWMVRWAQRLGELGSVHPFDYPYMQQGRKTPDRLPTLIQAHRAALTQLRTTQKRSPALSAAPIVLIGKSMGSRVGCHVSLEEQVSAVVCLGYPLKAMGKTGKLRTEVLEAMTTPVLFVQGERDPMCPLDGLEATRDRMRAPSALVVVEGGNHGLEVGKRALAAQGLTQDQLEGLLLGHIRDFLADHGVGERRP